MSDRTAAATDAAGERHKSTRVPNVFHFVFGMKPQTQPFHLMHYLCLVSCIGVNRPDSVIFHCQHEPWGEYWDRIRPYLKVVRIEPDSFVSSFHYRDPEVESLRYAHLADIARLQILAEYGGIYADMDTLFVSPLPASFFERSFIMGREPEQWSPAGSAAGGSLCNAWMMGEPNARFAREFLRQTYESFDGSWSNHSTVLAYRVSREYPEWIDIEPPRSFFHFDYSGTDIGNVFKRRVTDLAGIFSIHLWSHCWWEAAVMHSAFFHEGRLTPAYVRHADTTYAAIARPFLPQDLGRQDRVTWTKEQLYATVEDASWLRRKLVRFIARGGRPASDGKVPA
jgi:hypothetical protein